MLGVLVSLAAGVGAVARYVVDHAVQRRWRPLVPYGTWVVNVTGSLALGVLVGAADAHGVEASIVDVVGAGFLGGYTTLSTWAWETVALVDEGKRRAATVNALGSVAAGMLAAAAGLWLGGR